MGVVREIAKRNIADQDLRLVAPTASPNAILAPELKTDLKLPEIQKKLQEEINTWDQLGVLGRLKIRTWDKVVENFIKCQEGFKCLGAYTKNKFQGEETKQSFWGILKKLNIFSYISDGIVDPLFSLIDILREELTRGSMMLGRLLGGDNFKAAYVSYKDFRETEQREKLLQWSKGLFEIAEISLSLAITLLSAGTAGIGWKKGLLAIGNRIKVAGYFGFGGALGEELLQGEGHKIDVLKVTGNTLMSATHSIKFGAMTSALPGKLLSQGIDKIDALGDVYQVAVEDTERVLAKNAQGSDLDLLKLEDWLTVGRRSAGLFLKGKVALADLKDDPKTEVRKILAEENQETSPKIDSNITKAKELAPVAKPLNKNITAPYLPTLKARQLAKNTASLFPDAVLEPEINPMGRKVSFAMTGENTGLPDEGPGPKKRKQAPQTNDLDSAFALASIIETIFEYETFGTGHPASFYEPAISPSCASGVAENAFTEVLYELKKLLDTDLLVGEVLPEVRKKLTNITTDPHKSHAVQVVAEFCQRVLLPNDFSFNEIINSGDLFILGPNAEGYQVALFQAVAKTCVRRILEFGALEYADLLFSMNEKWKGAYPDSAILSKELINREVISLSKEVGIYFLSQEDHHLLLNKLNQIFPENTENWTALRTPHSPSRDRYLARAEGIPYKARLERIAYCLNDAVRKIKREVEPTAVLVELSNRLQIVRYSRFETDLNKKLSNEVIKKIYSDLIIVTENLISSTYDPRIIPKYLLDSIFSVAALVPRIEHAKEFKRNVFWLVTQQAIDQIMKIKKSEAVLGKTDPDAERRLLNCRAIISGASELKIVNAEDCHIILDTLDHLGSSAHDEFSESSLNVSDDWNTEESDQIIKELVLCCSIPRLLLPKLNNTISSILKIKRLAEDQQEQLNAQEHDFGKDYLEQEIEKHTKRYQYLLNQVVAASAIIARTLAKRGQRILVLTIARIISTEIHPLDNPPYQKPLWLIEEDNQSATDIFTDYLQLCYGDPKARVVPQPQRKVPLPPTARTRPPSDAPLTAKEQEHVVSFFREHAEKLRDFTKSAGKKQDHRRLIQELVEPLISNSSSSIPQGKLSYDGQEAIIIDIADILLTFTLHTNQPVRIALYDKWFYRLRKYFSGKQLSELKALAYYSAVDNFVQMIRPKFSESKLEDAAKRCSNLENHLKGLCANAEIKFAYDSLARNRRIILDTPEKWPLTMQYLKSPSDQTLALILADQKINPLTRFAIVLVVARRRAAEKTSPLVSSNEAKVLRESFFQHELDAKPYFTTENLADRAILFGSAEECLTEGLLYLDTFCSTRGLGKTLAANTISNLENVLEKLNGVLSLISRTADPKCSAMYMRVLFSLTELSLLQPDNRIAELLQKTAALAANVIVNHQEIVQYLCWRSITLAALIDGIKPVASDTASARYLTLAEKFAAYINDENTQSEVRMYEALSEIDMGHDPDIQKLEEFFPWTRQFLSLLQYSIKQNETLLALSGANHPQDLKRKQRTCMFLLSAKLSAYLRSGDPARLSDAQQIHQTLSAPEIPDWFLTALNNLVLNDVQIEDEANRREKIRTFLDSL